jgi:hypothetical protein
MPGTELKQMSQVILSQILTMAFNVDESTPFEELLQKCDEIEFSREETLNRANERICSLLNNQANTNVKLHH